MDTPVIHWTVRIAVSLLVACLCHVCWRFYGHPAEPDVGQIVVPRVYYVARDTGLRLVWLKRKDGLGVFSGIDMETNQRVRVPEDAIARWPASPSENIYAP